MQQIQFLSHKIVDSKYGLVLATDVNLPEGVMLIPVSHGRRVFYLLFSPFGSGERVSQRFTPR